MSPDLREELRSNIVAGIGFGIGSALLVVGAAVLFRAFNVRVPGLPTA